MAKRTVVLLFGGQSSEHSISCATAGGVLNSIDLEAYTVIPVGITREGLFVLESEDPDRFRLNPENMPEVVDNGTRVIWPESTQSRELRVRDVNGERSLGNIDIVFPILHGRFGEDGTIQGYLELLGLPYVGNGVLASAIAMDKNATKSILDAAGIEVAPWVSVTPHDWGLNPSHVKSRARSLGLPVFVKPSRAGSSVGVSKVNDWDELSTALELAFKEDGTALIEAAIVGRELEIAVLGGRGGAAARVSVAGEVRVTGRDFYDFDAKYLDGSGVELLCPATLSKSELEEFQRIALRAFVALGAEGIARVDVFLGDEGFVVNEINTMPGFTAISMYPRCWVNSGVTYPELITELIEIGLERGAR